MNVEFVEKLEAEITKQAKQIEELHRHTRNLQIANSREVERRRVAEGTSRAFASPAVQRVINEIRAEFDSVVAKREPFVNAHEAYGVLLEEVDELWDEIKRKESSRSRPAIRNEAKQVATVAIRLMVELTT